MILETKRLYLEEMKDEDYNDLCEILQDEKAMYAYEHAFSNEEVWAWLKRQQKRYVEDGFGLWAVRRKSDHQMVGQCGLSWQMIPDEQVLEIGYLFKRKYWHNGYAIEAAKACKQYAFDVLHAPCVYSIIRNTNVSSQQVAKRNNMKKVGQFIKHAYGIDMPHDIYKNENHEEKAERVE